MKLTLSTITAGLREERLWERVVEYHGTVQQSRDACLAWARQGLKALIAAGELLIEAREKLSGDFEDWLEAQIASLPEEARFSRKTAGNYMRAVRFKESLEDDDPEFASVKELYIAAGILPLPPPGGQGGSGSAPVYTLSLKLNAPEPEKWDPMDRREFLQKAKPIIDLYERVKAAEAAS